MYYTFVNVINETPQMVTLNSVTGFDQGNMFLTDGSLTVPSNGGQSPVVANGQLSGSLTYNITEQMVLVMQWSQGAGMPPQNFVPTVDGGSEYNVNYTGPVITTDPNNAKVSHYTYTVTLGPVAES